MCNRFRAPREPAAIARQFGVAQTLNYEFNPNVAPSEPAPILRTSKSEGRRLELARFGLVPPWAKSAKEGVRFLNARSESIRDTPAYRQAYSVRRCVVPCEGFYEWREEDGRKLPYLFARADGALMALAGIWQFAEMAGERLFSFAIVTGEANDAIAPYHDRMPLVVTDPGRWLDDRRDPLPGLALLPSEGFTVRPMNPAMNRPGLKDLDAIEAPRAAPPAAQLGLFS